MRPAQGDRGRDDLITSPANPTIKLARSLHRRRMRYRERAVLVEGTRALQSALELGAVVRAALLDASRVADVDAALVARLRGAAGRLLLVDSALFQLVSATESPQPVIAICDMPAIALPADCTFVIAIDGVRDPGNLGTLARSAAAAGVDGLALLHGSADPYGPKAIRASAGSIFGIPLEPHADLEQIATSAFVRRPRIVVAEAGAERSYDSVDWTGPSLIVIGGEATGPGESVRTYADFVVSIPMAAGIESLNAGVAGAIVAFEVARQRRRRG